MAILATIVLDSGCFFPNERDPYCEVGYFESERSASDITVFADGEQIESTSPFKLGRNCLIEVYHLNASRNRKTDGVTAAHGLHHCFLHLKDLYGEDMPVEPMKFDCIIRFYSGHLCASMIKPRKYDRMDGNSALLESRMVGPFAHDMAIQYLLEDGEALQMRRDGKIFWSSEDYPANQRLDIQIVADNSTTEKFYRDALHLGTDSYWLPNHGDPLPFTGGGGPAFEFDRFRHGARTYRPGGAGASGEIRDGGMKSGGGATRTRGRKTKVPGKPTLHGFTCYFHGAMESEIILKHATSIEVSISREVIEQVTSATAAGGKSEIDPSRKLILQVFPKQNLDIIGDDRFEIDPPEPGKPEQVIFDVRPTHLGEGEVWVVARQGQVPLVTLKLKPQIVKARTAIPTELTDEGRASESKRQPEPFNELTISGNNHGDQSVFDFVLHLPDLKLRVTGSSKALQGDRKKYVENLYKEIESRWLRSKSDVEAFLRTIRSKGGELFDELIPQAIQAALWEHRGSLKSILVFTDEPLIPWELVHVKEPGKGLPTETKFLGQMGLVRWPQDRGFPPDDLKIRNGRARYVIPNYPEADLKLPEAESEAKFLKDAFTATAVEPHSKSVTDLLRTGEFDLLHFACHGYAEQDDISNAGLLMQGRIENGEYKEDCLTSSEAEQNRNPGGPDQNRPMVVLNACQVGRAAYKLTGIGGFATAFITGNAGAFIGTLWSVGDSPARTFTETFYSELLKGSRIANAAIKAREAARQAGDATWLAYVVYGNPQAVVTR